MVKKFARRTRRTHTPALKAQVAVAALREDRTLAELAKHLRHWPPKRDELIFVSSGTKHFAPNKSRSVSVAASVRVDSALPHSEPRSGPAAH